MSEYYLGVYRQSKKFPQQVLLYPEERQAAFNRLAILAGLRKPRYEAMKQEAKKMPITIDIREHPPTAEAYGRGRQEG